MWAESATAQQRAMAAAGGGDLAMAQAWVWSAEVEDDAKELDNACCNRMFQMFQIFLRMLQVFYINIAKADLGFLSKCSILNETFECSTQHKTNVAANFFLIINGWLITFFQYIF